MQTNTLTSSSGFSSGTYGSGAESPGDSALPKIVASISAASAPPQQSFT